MPPKQHASTLEECTQEDDDDNEEEEAEAAPAVLVEQGKEVAVEAGGLPAQLELG